MQGRYRDGIPDDEKKRILGCLFSGAILVAPFVALLYSPTIALIVLVGGLGTAAWFAYEASRTSDDAARTRLRLLAGINLALLLVVLVALVWLETQ